METFWNLTIFCCIVITVRCKSLDDYKACQILSNCSRNLIPADCFSGEYIDTKFKSGCCHGCHAGKISRGESGCSMTRANENCAPGLKCDDDFYCVLDRTSCFHTMHFADSVTFKPKCEIDGTYFPKQCRGDRLTGRCFCYAETGERIFGWDWWLSSAAMTCACSRQRHKAEATGRLDVGLHCRTNGNFEQLQCDLGICWCADQFDGHILNQTFAVPEYLWTYLPCYNSSFHGDHYLRKCESAAYAQTIVQKKLIQRGAINALPNRIMCNFDGSYGDIVIENTLAFCQTADGTKLNYAAPSKMLSEMSCNCARDEKIFKSNGIQFNLRCKDNGNYESVGDQNGDFFCVDRDGYAVTGLLSTDFGLDCDQFFYYTQEDYFIDNEAELN